MISLRSWKSNSVDNYFLCIRPFSIMMVKPSILQLHFWPNSLKTTEKDLDWKGFFWRVFQKKKKTAILPPRQSGRINWTFLSLAKHSTGEENMAAFLFRSSFCEKLSLSAGVDHAQYAQLWPRSEYFYDLSTHGICRYRILDSVNGDMENSKTRRRSCKNKTKMARNSENS